MEQFSIKKAVAIFDMPECCQKCPITLFNNDTGDCICPLTGEFSNCDNAAHERGEQCPLREMEVKIEIDI